MMIHGCHTHKKTAPEPGPEAHQAAVKRCVTHTGAGIGDQGGRVTPNYGALIDLCVRWRAQPIEKHKTKKIQRVLCDCCIS